MSYKDLKRVTVGCIDCGWTGRRLYHPCGNPGQQYGKCGQCRQPELLVPIKRFRELDAGNRCHLQLVNHPEMVIARLDR